MSQEHETADSLLADMRRKYLHATALANDSDWAKGKPITAMILARWLPIVEGLQSSLAIYKGRNEGKQIVINQLERENVELRKALADAMTEVSQLRGEYESPQAEIATVEIRDGQAVGVTLKAPGLPDGTHDLFCAPVHEPSPSHSADHLQRFTDWLVREMPAGTLIGDPTWWARKLLAAACVFADEAPAHETSRALCDGGTCGLGGFCDDCPKQEQLARDTAENKTVLGFGPEHNDLPPFQRIKGYAGNGGW